ncbi:hypothetical protein CAOG_010174 [Capsaspora owczarzaki ATCC 30864]|uniref:Uncharacterized protein n=1 Tax=Capsaspora owczarzaki (strain ATCC 30864) TaxID=595528 RepID=A0A0D2WYG6_CAPO3|nr:hypothetical protein CAOG_010174 [Capsaspora owczarzaki ATCC 30864]
MLEFVCDAFRSSLVPPADSARWPSEALAVALNASDTLQSIDNLLSQLRFNDYELPATILTALLPFVDWITPFVICIFKNLMHVARSRAATELVQSQDSGSSASNTTPFLSFLFQSDAAQLLRETLVYASLLKHQASISTSKVIQQHNNVQQQQQQHSQPQYEQQQQQIYDSAASLGALNHGVARESSATIKKLFNILSEISFKAARDDISNLISALEVLQKPEYEQTRLMRSLQLSSTSRGVLGQLAHVVHGPALRVLARDAPDTAITAATPVACPAFLFGKATKSLVPGIFNSTAEVVPGREVDGVNSPHGGRGVASPPAEVPGSVLLSDVMEGDAFDDDTTDARFTVRSRRSVSLAALNSVQKTTGSTVTEPPHARRDVLKQTFVSGTVDFRECMR